MLEESLYIIVWAVATSVGTAVATSVGTAVGNNVCNFWIRLLNKMSKVDLQNNHERLIKEEIKLHDTRDDLLAQANTKFVTQVFEEAWTSTLKKTEEEVHELKTKYNNGKSKKRKYSELLCWSSESWESRTELSVRMAEMCEKLSNLVLKGNSEIQHMVKNLPERVITLEDPRLKADEPFYSSHVSGILSHLGTSDVKIIGIWGIVGSGKTILLKILNNDKNIAEMFDIVIRVTVSKDWSSEDSLRAIANRLKLDMEGIIDPDEIAQQLSKEIKSKKCLLLLDEVEKEDVVRRIIEMFSNKEMKSMVVLATRFRDVCRAVNCDEIIKMKGLSQNDAWEMFRSRAGRYVDLPGFQPTAKLVFKECGNWPLLIDTVARNFGKMDNVELWKNGLERLRSPKKKLEGTDEFIPILKFCYENLADEVTKKCFLSCAKYPEDEEIRKDNLLESWTVIIRDADEFREARGKGYAILNELINMSFLEEGEEEDHVRMNRVLRKMARDISYQEFGEIL